MTPEGKQRPTTDHTSSTDSVLVRRAVLEAALAEIGELIERRKVQGLSVDHVREVLGELLEALR